MVFWLLAIVVTAIVCAALYFASAGRSMNAIAGTAVQGHFRLQLRDIETDLANGRLGPNEALAAKSELAREVLRLEGEARQVKPVGQREATVLPFAVLAVAIIAFGTYSFIGNPEQPSQPLAGRTAEQPAMDLATALQTLDTQLVARPDDPDLLALAGTLYLQGGRVDDAIAVLRHALEVAPPTADRETDLAEALLLKQSGVMAGEPQALLESAVAREPTHIRSRFYLAAEATRSGDFASAVTQWRALLADASDDEPWVAAARNGLSMAEAGLDGGDAAVPDATAIRGMVDGLSERLFVSGGTIEEWTQLVRSRLVLGDAAEAQRAYDAAKLAYPDAATRAELDTISLTGGLR
ncbi:MAG: hypothetical protein JWR75_1944 [Devosia sp.]|nr:hypothetical protein [Devosia sp.]